MAGHPAASGGSLAPSSIGNFVPMSWVSENRTKIYLEALFIRRLKVEEVGGGQQRHPRECCCPVRSGLQGELKQGSLRAHAASGNWKPVVLPAKVVSQGMAAVGA